MPWNSISWTPIPGTAPYTAWPKWIDRDPAAGNGPYPKPKPKANPLLGRRGRNGKTRLLKLPTVEPLAERQAKPSGRAPPSDAPLRRHSRHPARRLAYSVATGRRWRRCPGKLPRTNQSANHAHANVAPRNKLALVPANSD